MIWGDFFVKKTEMGTTIFIGTPYRAWFLCIYMLFRRNSFMGQRDKHLANL